MQELAVLWFVAVLLILCLLFFSSLTITVTQERIFLRFGTGIIRKQFLLQDIKSCKATRSPWYYGWGIHLLPEGWIYNISGFWSVELEMKNGRKHRIGTDEPEVLKKVIQKALKHH